jgi:hypothetical protein
MKCIASAYFNHAMKLTASILKESDIIAHVNITFYPVGY